MKVIESCFAPFMTITRDRPRLPRIFGPPSPRSRSLPRRCGNPDPIGPKRWSAKGLATESDRRFRRELLLFFLASNELGAMNFLASLMRKSEVSKAQNKCAIEDDLIAV